MRILCDMDGVMAQTTEYMLSLYNRDYVDNLVPEDITDFDMSKFVKPQCGKAIYNYMDHTPGFFQYLKLVDGVVEAFKELLALGHDVVIATASPRASKTGFYDKVRWVKTNLPFFDTKSIIAAHRKDLIAGDLLLDDAPHNLEAFPKISVAFDQPWNQNAKCDYRVKTWSEFVSLIKGLEL